MTSLQALRRFARPRSPARAEACGLCAADLDPVHRHIVDLERRVLLCACRACAVLFAARGTEPGRYRTVPDRVLRDDSFRLSSLQWSSLGVPVRLAFVMFHSNLRRWSAFYPSPAGAVESTLDLDLDEKIGRAALIDEIEPDVEAWVVYGPRGSDELRCLLAPVDTCYELVGRVRRLWRGIDGGDAVWSEIDDWFARLRGRSRPLSTGKKEISS